MRRQQNEKGTAPHLKRFLIIWRLFHDLSGEPHHQAGAPDGEQDAGYPAAAADAQQIAQESTHEAADDAKESVLEKAFGISVHDFVGNGAGQRADDQ